MDQRAYPHVAAGIARLYRTLWTHAAGQRRRLAGFLSLLFAAQTVRRQAH